MGFKRVNIYYGMPIFCSKWPWPYCDSWITRVSWVRLRGPVIQANGSLTFEDDLRSEGLLCFTTQ